MGALGASGSVFANALANSADVVIGLGTRYTDFTTASNTLFAPDAAFVNINVAELDAHKEAGLPLVGDAREVLAELAELLGDHAVAPAYRTQVQEAAGGPVLVWAPHQRPIDGYGPPDRW